MIRSRALFGLLVAALAMLYAAGATTAAWACAAPQIMASPPMKSGCDDQRKAHDCALSCAPLCAAVAPTLVKTATQNLLPEMAFWAKSSLKSSHQAGPEPPPPRTE